MQLMTPTQETAASKPLNIAETPAQSISRYYTDGQGVWRISAKGPIMFRHIGGQWMKSALNKLFIMRSPKLTETDAERGEP